MPEENVVPVAATGLIGFLAKFTVLKGAQRELWLTFLIKFLIYTAYSVTNKTMVLWLSKDLGFNDQAAAKQRAQLRRGWSACRQLKECEADEDGRADADQVHKEHGAQGVSRVLDLHAPEINGDDIEGGLGRALENAGEPAGKGVGAVCTHGVDEESAATG